MQKTLFSYPEYVEIGTKKYKINTDYRVAIRCNEISKLNVENMEKALAIIYLLFGEEAMKDVKHYEELMNKASYYLNCGNVDEEDKSKYEKPDMDLIQDFPYIVASFKSDYNGFDITKEKIHWWDFYYMLSGLSQSEMGNCCVLNRIRELRSKDPSKITDPEERNRLIKAQKKFALKFEKEEKEFSEEELKNMEEYHKLIGK